MDHFQCLVAGCWAKGQDGAWVEQHAKENPGHEVFNVLMYFCREEGCAYKAFFKEVFRRHQESSGHKKYNLLWDHS